MSAWEHKIFAEDANIDFLDELAELENEDIIEAIRDACVLATSGGRLSEDEINNGYAAATIAAIWCGAPYSAGDVVESYPFIRTLIGHADEALAEAASEVLEGAETEEDLEALIEALS
ncbi:DUF4259 domain-containing protein [Corynebacterium sp. SCR221107]|uniref:DUF4259 domain-containing protein n=1 Tax=Corynebacterium sp. SCR221107 TaxID=3017361 RepID=UPI0022EC9598|nr:DUF4259 domain-containing protein [Corynebacterium sp. SCR221107]WBT09340.1 DUF4259 domain-containing protein [Corynebacterium sp. SCR221107]